MKLNPITNLKICSSCRTELPVSDFNKSKGRPDGYDNYCRNCTRKKSLNFYYSNHEQELEKRAEYRKSHTNETLNHRRMIREQLKEKNREYREAHPEEIAKSKKAWYEKNRDRNKNTALLRTYGITLETFHEIWDKQKGECPGCGTKLVYKKGGYCIDHNHITGKFRWILCSSCNYTLGHAKDNPELLRNLATMLESI